MDELTLKFLKGFVDNKLNQTRCTDPYMWSRVHDYITKQLNQLKEVKK